MNLLLWLGKHWKLVGWAATAALLWYVMGRADHWHQQTIAARLELKMMVLQVKTVTAEVYAKAAGRMLATERAQRAIDEKKIHEKASDLAAQRKRYSLLLAQVRAHKHTPGEPASVSVWSPPSGGFAEDAAHPGFWSIRAEDALSILEAADIAVTSFKNVVGWADEQYEVTIPLDPVE